jgi:surface polysaccharide O-acyltransferase-like enzyme
LAGLDILKAVAALTVVGIHAAPQVGAFYLEHVNGGLLRLGVPIFLGISGYLVGRAGTSQARFRRTTWRFVRLHIVWAVFYWAFAYAQGTTGIPTTLKAVAVRFADGAYPGQYYFVILIQVYGFCSLLPDRREEHFCGSRMSLLLGVVASGASLVLHDVIGSGGLGLPRGLSQVVSSANGIWLWWVFFTAGAFAGRREREGAWVFDGRLALAGTLLASAVALIAQPEFPRALEFSHAPYARLTVQVAAVVLILSLPGWSHLSAPRWVLLAGQRSFGVFVLNPALLFGVSAAVGMPAGWPETWAQAVFVMGLACWLQPRIERLFPWSMR